MEVNGHQLRESIKLWGMKLNTVKPQFEDALHAFDDEEKEAPLDIDARIHECEMAIARLQTAQVYYNLHTKVQIDDNEVSLAFAVKAVGGMGRREGRWRQAAEPDRYDPYAYRRNQHLERNPDTEVARRTISHKESLAVASAAARTASKFRAGIAQANLQTLDIPDDMLQEGDLL